jgi:hypothetical protein
LKLPKLTPALRRALDTVERQGSLDGVRYDVFMRVMVHDLVRFGDTRPDGSRALVLSERAIALRRKNKS